MRRIRLALLATIALSAPSIAAEGTCPGASHPSPGIVEGTSGKEAAPVAPATMPSPAKAKRPASQVRLA